MQHFKSNASKLTNMAANWQAKELTALTSDGIQLRCLVSPDYFFNYVNVATFRQRLHPAPNDHSPTTYDETDDVVYYRDQKLASVLTVRIGRLRVPVVDPKATTETGVYDLIVGRGFSHIYEYVGRISDEAANQVLMEDPLMDLLYGGQLQVLRRDLPFEEALELEPGPAVHYRAT